PNPALQDIADDGIHSMTKQTKAKYVRLGAGGHMVASIRHRCDYEPTQPDDLSTMSKINPSI
ncbi:MAG: hypothetical protein ACREEV_13475, partial [Dongiaceae bacterium]